MKKINLLNPILLFVAILSFSSCDESGEVQFQIKDDFSTSIPVAGLQNQSSFTISSSTDISDLLDNASNFVEAEVETITVALEDYSGTSIDGNILVAIGANTLFATDLTLSSTPTPVNISGNSNILSLITSGAFPVSVTATANEPLVDNNFSLKLTFGIKATVQ